MSHDHHHTRINKEPYRGGGTASPSPSEPSELLNALTVVGLKTIKHREETQPQHSESIHEKHHDPQYHLIPCSLVKIEKGVFFPLILPKLLGEDEGLMKWLQHYQTEIKPPKLLSPNELMETMETLEQYLKSHHEWQSKYPHTASTRLPDDAFAQLDKYCMRMMNLITSRILGRRNEEEEDSTNRSSSTSSVQSCTFSLPSECMDRKNEKKPVMELYNIVFSLFDDSNIPFLITNNERRAIENKKELSTISQFLKEFVENHDDRMEQTLHVELLPSMVEFKHSCNKEKHSLNNVLEDIRLQWVPGLLADLDLTMTRNFKTPTSHERVGFLCTEYAISGEFSMSNILQCGNWIIIRNVCNLPLKLMELSSNCGAGILADKSNMFIYKVVKRPKPLSEFSPKFEWTYCTHFDLNSLEQRCMAFAVLWTLLLDLKKENKSINTSSQKYLKDFVSKAEKLLMHPKTMALTGHGGEKQQQPLRKLTGEKVQPLGSASVTPLKSHEQQQHTVWHLDEHLKSEHKKMVDEMSSPIYKMMHQRDVKERTEKILKNLDLANRKMDCNKDIEL
ncbi:hypothetical protein C9374_003078 [Naegleria lovaniensis]|uniref:Uncharacterized protein n=1 Tax=Naegleria lovaniensis TaxID=51637 RepID=A0AA88KLK6_NAELO|nr:uncharacterized protein C9374_003078 [Naegleria lovaniensis]KAG2385929.1 hypothetical protein C9374_003078 [Naegleria lovaniensis]